MKRHIDGSRRTAGRFFFMVALCAAVGGASRAESAAPPVPTPVPESDSNAKGKGALGKELDAVSYHQQLVDLAAKVTALLDTIQKLIALAPQLPGPTPIPPEDGKSKLPVFQFPKRMVPDEHKCSGILTQRTADGCKFLSEAQCLADTPSDPEASVLPILRKLSANPHPVAGYPSFKVIHTVANLGFGVEMSTSGGQSSAPASSVKGLGWGASPVELTGDKKDCDAAFAKQEPISYCGTEEPLSALQLYAGPGKPLVDAKRAEAASLFADAKVQFDPPGALVGVLSGAPPSEKYPFVIATSAKGTCLAGVVGAIASLSLSKDTKHLFKFTPITPHVPPTADAGRPKPKAIPHGQVIESPLGTSPVALRCGPLGRRCRPVPAH